MAPSPPAAGEPTAPRGSTADQPQADSTEPLSPELELAAQLLADGSSDAAAGLSVGRSAKWVQRARANRPEFKARVSELKEGRTRQAAAGLGSLLEEARAAVQRGLVAPKTSDQLRAAALVYDRFVVLGAQAEAAEQVRDLKASVLELRAKLSSIPGQQESGQ